ncbi:hypothetical protein ACFSGX_14215 [Sphingomonas arantia]|uniref:DUF3887 domain-containing protein n=1 Tax=Sphingomonas arantia TaxID=1460676 RepID=A0ABW4U1I9_9SPHN
MNLIVALLAAAAPITPVSNAETPTAIVERLLQASTKQDWPTALAMLTADAQLGMGDVGGPLDKATVSILGVLDRYGCRRTSIRETTQRDPVQSQIRFVEVRRICPYGPQSGRSGEHELITTYFVNGTKIAGFYLK